MKPNGYIIHQDEKIVAIATGFARASKNAKTGKGTIAIWILGRETDPTSATRNGQDNLVCLDCPLRGKLVDGKLVNRACYVRTDALNSIWKAYHAGSYGTAIFGAAGLFLDKFVRFGAYGEPVLLPFGLVEQIASVAKSFTGYTHQWRNPVYQAYKQFFMASTHEGDYQEAKATGWRTFTVSKVKLDGLVVCPASAESGKRTTCEQCGLCAGTTRKAKSIQIQPHGNGAKYV